MLNYFNRSGCGTFIAYDHINKVIYSTKAHVGQDDIVFDGNVRKSTLSSDHTFLNTRDLSYELAQLVCDDKREFDKIIPSNAFLTPNPIRTKDMFDRATKKIINEFN